MDWAMPLGTSTATLPSPVPARKKARVLRHQTSARYDAAQTTVENARHWANAEGLSARSANSPGVRRILRNRARYEVANNCYAWGIIRTLANDLIGTGPRLQLLSDDVEMTAYIEREFATWAKEIHLAQKLRTMRISLAQDGEAFAVLTTNPNHKHPVLLDIALVEADRVATPDLISTINTRDIDGIKLDKFGNPVSYTILNNHPGDIGIYTNPSTKPYPVSNVIHWFRADRPGQMRGVPDITPALPLFSQLRRYTLAVLSAAEIAAEWTLFLKTNSPPDEGATEIEDGAFGAIDIERGMMTSLPEGWDPFQLKPEQPTTTYKMFKDEILNEIARCMNIPFNVAAGNSSGYNYASGRLDNQTYFKSIRVDQTDMEILVIDRILSAWLAEASYSLVDYKVPQALPHQWFWDGTEHVDPAKEANAQKIRLANLTTTRATEYARAGKDWETELRQIAKEKALMNELGILVSENTEDESDDEIEDEEEK